MDDRLSNLATEYEAITNAFAYPFNAKERETLKARRDAILVEARQAGFALLLSGISILLAEVTHC
jgi:hypothetical protein